MSAKTYKTEQSFRREAARRLQLTAIDESLWDETGGTRWRDAHAERGFALDVDLGFVVSQLRHKRRSGELPRPTITIVDEPNERRIWWLRSRFTAWSLEPRARVWRREHIPPTLPRDAAHDRWLDPDRWTIQEGSAREWMQGLARFEDGFFVGMPVVRGGPYIQIPEPSLIFFSFPEEDPPRYMDDRGAARQWWSTSRRPGDRLELQARIPSETAGEVCATLAATELILGLEREWSWIKGGTTWSLGATAGFYIFGATPILVPLRAETTSVTDEAGFGERITLEVDPRITPLELMHFYSRVRAGDSAPGPHRRPTRSLTPRVIELTDFVLSRTISGQRIKWNELWSEWQTMGRAESEAQYSSAATMERVFRRAQGKLVREFWPR